MHRRFSTSLVASAIVGAAGSASRSDQSGHSADERRRIFFTEQLGGLFRHAFKKQRPSTADRRLEAGAAFRLGAPHRGLWRNDWRAGGECRRRQDDSVSWTGGPSTKCTIVAPVEDRH